jgi:hypothetical protein
MSDKKLLVEITNCNVKKLDLKVCAGTRPRVRSPAAAGCLRLALPVRATFEDAS